MLALSAAEGTIVVSATGAVVLLALVAFGIWWFKPFRAASKREAMTLERREREREREREHGDDRR